MSKMSKISSAKYYQKNKERLQKNNLKGIIQIFLKYRKTKSNNMVWNDIKVSEKMKSKSYLSAEKKKNYFTENYLTNKD